MGIQQWLYLSIRTAEGILVIENDWKKFFEDLVNKILDAEKITKNR